MNTTRLEAFSDAVIAIIMTIMVLELRVPHGTDLASLRPILPIFVSYVLSFIYLGIYWNNHHHMLQATYSVNGAVLWANLHLLFWLSLMPFTTGWMGENNFDTLPTAVYGVVLLSAAVSYTILQTVIMRHHKDENKLLKEAIGNDLKGKISMLLCSRDLSGFRQSLDLVRDIHCGCRDLAGSGQKNRKASHAC